MLNRHRPKTNYPKKHKELFNEFLDIDKKENNMNIEEILLKYNLNLIKIEEKNRSYIAGTDIYIGVYDNKELELISIFHEIGHIELPDMFSVDSNYNTLLIEIECWNIGIRIAQDLGIFFTDNAIQWGYNQAMTYNGYSEREYLDWEERVKPTLWINKGK